MSLDAYKCGCCDRPVPMDTESCPYCHTPILGVHCRECGHLAKPETIRDHCCPRCGHDFMGENGKERLRNVLLALAIVSFFTILKYIFD